MFCKKCGMKIERGASKCSHCGESAATAEYCGGFWGITRLEQGNTEKQRNNLATEDLSKYRDAVLAAQETEEKMARQYSEEIRALKAERRKLEVSCLKRTLLAVVLGLFAVVFLVLMVKGFFRKNKLEKDLAGLQKQVEEADPGNQAGQVPEQSDSDRSESNDNSVNTQTEGEEQTEQAEETGQGAGEAGSTDPGGQGDASGDSGTGEAGDTDSDSGASGQG